ncbi:MAG: MFS transporter [Pseudonocardiaceae bacterium]|nr:MFS transporter [Pseudonocardiaceae bacterium]
MNAASPQTAGPGYATPGLGSRSFRLMLVASFAGFGGYALLLPVVPLWASTGGAAEFGAGATTGVLMASTVATQLGVPWLLHRVGHRVVLAAGMLLLGAPSPLYAVAPDLLLLLAVSLLRGIGFGLLTVAGSALIAELVPSPELGRASSRYGLAVGLPLLVLLPAGVGVAQLVGFAPLFMLAGVLPVVSVVAVPWIRLPHRGEPAVDETTPAQRWRVVRATAGPWLVMLTCSIAQGGLITFLPLAVPQPGVLVPTALLATTAGTLLGRLVAGELTDRRGMAGRLLPVGVLGAAIGMVIEMLAVGGSGPLSAVAVVAGAALVGIGFGAVQNDSLVMLFGSVGSTGYGAASAAWNIAYDTGTGVGATGLGAVAQPLGFEAAFGVSATLLALILPSVLVTHRRGG